MATITRLPSIFNLVDEFENSFNGSGSYFPPIEIRKGEKEYRVLAHLPGVKKENVDVHVENGYLTISGKYAPQETQGFQIVRSEFATYGEFKRSLKIDPGAFNLNEIEAQLSDGVLELKLPLSESVQPRQIEVKVS